MNVNLCSFLKAREKKKEIRKICRIVWKEQENCTIFNYFVGQKEGVMLVKRNILLRSDDALPPPNEKLSLIMKGKKNLKNGWVIAPSLSFAEALQGIALSDTMLSREEPTPYLRIPLQSPNSCLKVCIHTYHVTWEVLVTMDVMKRMLTIEQIFPSTPKIPEEILEELYSCFLIKKGSSIMWLGKWKQPNDHKKERLYSFHIEREKPFPSS
jgi:hypothetical protein